MKTKYILPLALIATATAHGVTITKTFEIFGENGSPLGTGWFSTSDWVFNGPGDVYTPWHLSFDLEVTVLGQTFTEQDDMHYYGVEYYGHPENAPIITIENGELRYIDFVVREVADINPVSIDRPGVDRIYFSSAFTAHETGAYDYAVSMVPEPGIYACVAGLVIMAIVAVRRRK